MITYIIILLILFTFSIFFEVRYIYNFTLNLKNNLGINSLIYLSIGYTIILALTFLPGIELGICIMCIYGKWGITAVYLSTVIGLSLSFLAGKYYGERFNRKNNRITRLFNSLSYFIPRVMAMGLLLNTPKNALIGGGGGISFSLGLDKNFKLLHFSQS